MTYDSEEIRHAFHALSTQTQYEWVRWDEKLAASGYEMRILEVKTDEDGLKVSVRIDLQRESRASSKT